MANKNLYSLISNASQQAMSKGKVPIGYATSSYEDVLKALKHTKVVFNDIIQQGQNQTVVTRQSTTLTKLGIAGAADDTGFIVFDDNKISYQAVCTLKDYMSFVINYTTQGSQTKQERGFVSVPDRPAPRCHATQGMSLLQGSLPTFPPTTLENETIKRLSQGLDGQSSTCIIGVGISISDFAMKFFNRFFQEIKWSVDTLDKLSSKGFLFAEVLLPTSDSEALVLHSKVTVKHQINDQSSPFEVWLPIPILLLTQFSKLGQVFVTTGNNTQGKVGENGITFPLSDSSYSHKNAAINGFTPSFLRAYVSDVQGLPKFVSTNLCNSKVQQKARVRLYLSPDCKQYLTQLINGEIPQSYQTELFRGQAQPSSYTKLEVIGSIVGGDADFAYWNEIGAEIGLSGTLVERAVGAVGRFESGGKWEAWEQANDTQGISAGFLQFTQKAGGIKDYCDFYKELQPTDPSAPPMSAQMYSAVNRYSGQNNAAPLKQFAEQFAAQSKSTAGKVAQIKAWQGKGDNKLKRKYTVEWFKKFKCTSAAQFMAIFGAINHLPSWFNGDKPHTKRGYKNWLDYKMPDDAEERAKILQAIHWIEYIDYNKHTTIDTRDPKVLLSDITSHWPLPANSGQKVNENNKGHRRRMVKSVELWGESNKNLQGWNTFSW